MAQIDAELTFRPFDEKDFEPLAELVGRTWLDDFPARAQATAAIAARYGFVDIGCRLYHRTRTLSAAQYLDLLGTYSDYLAMPAAVRQAFAADLSAVIAAHGGEVRLYDTLDLELARRRSC